MHIRKGHHQKTNCVCVWHKTRRKRTFEKTDSWKELSWDHDLCVQCRVPFGNEDVNQRQAKTFSHLNKLCHNFHRLNVQPIFWLDFVIGTKEKRCEQFRARILYLSSQRGPSLFFLSTSTRSSRIFIRAKYKYIFCCFLFLSTLYNNKKKSFLKVAAAAPRLLFFVLYTMATHSCLHFSCFFPSVLFSTLFGVPGPWALATRCAR